MDSNAYTFSYHEFAGCDMAPTLSSGRNQDWSLVAMQTPALPSTGVQNLDVYQSASLGPNSSLAQHAPPVLQEALTQQSSETLDNSYVLSDQSGHFQEDVAVQMDWTQYPNEGDWEQHKPKIIDLYRKVALKEVMATMKRDHNFKASTKMYKDRIRKWEIDKNIKGHEKMAIIRKQAQRSQTGKKSLFHLRNSQVPEHKIIRYRKAMKLLSEEQALTLRAETPPGLICHTPPASPLTTPLVLEIPERIARLVQDFIEGSFDSGTWLISESEDIVSTKGSKSDLDTFEQQVIHALWHFQKGKSSYAWRILRMAMASIEHIVSAEHPVTLDHLASILHTTLSPNMSGITFLLLKQFYAMSAAILPKQHPFNQVFARLVRLDVSHLKYILFIAKESHLVLFERKLGRFHEDTLNIQRSLLRLKSLEGASHTTEGYLTLLQAMELALDASDHRLLRMRNQLASHYCTGGEYVKAAETAQNIIDRITETGKIYVRELARALFLLSGAQYKFSTTLAEQNLRQAIQTRADYLGWEDGIMLNYMLDLEIWLEEWKRPDDAAEVRRHREEIVNSMEERITREEEERCQRLGITDA